MKKAPNMKQLDNQIYEYVGNLCKKACSGVIVIIPWKVAGDLENLWRQKNDIYPAIIFWETTCMSCCIQYCILKENYLPIEICYHVIWVL